MVGTYTKPVSNPLDNLTVRYMTQRYTLQDLKNEVARLMELSAELVASGATNNEYKKLIPYYEAAINIKEDTN